MHKMAIVHCQEAVIVKTIFQFLSTMHLDEYLEHSDKCFIQNLHRYENIILV